MNSHLPPDRISSWMMGERTPLEEQHVRECTQCGAELAGMQSALAEFGNAVRGMETVAKAAGAVNRARPLRWAWAVAALLLVTALPIYREDQQRKAERARADATLMEQVDVQVSRAIATPMEPLAKLMTWDGKQ